MSFQNQFSIPNELLKNSALEFHMRMSEAVQDKNIWHYLVLIQLTKCKLMAIMHEIINDDRKFVSLCNFQISYLPENANNVKQRI